MWRLYRYAITIRILIRILRVLLSPFSDKRVEQIVQLIERVGLNIEALRIVSDNAVFTPKEDTAL